MHTFVGYKTETHRHRQQYSGYQREGRLGVIKGKGGQIYGDRRLFDFGWWAHTMQYTGNVSQKCALETYMTQLINVTLLN